MNTEQFAYWLNGFITYKETLSLQEVEHIKTMSSIATGINLPDPQPKIPPVKDVVKMLKTFYPDLDPDSKEFKKLLLQFKSI